jgi:hypothetical protein
MASPLVGGYAALLAQQQPSLCPAQIHDAVVQRATTGVIGRLDAASPNRLLFIDTAPISTVVKAGRPNNLVVTAHDRSLKVSWDRPCDGGSAFTKFIVAVYRNGTFVKKTTVKAASGITRIGGLQNGVSYQVAVRPFTELGKSKASTRVASPQLRTLRVGQTVPTSRLVKAQQGRDPRWRISSGSRGLCAILKNPQRLVAKSRGRCNVRITPIHAESSVIHSFTVQ